MKSKVQSLLEEAYQSIQETSMPPTAGEASRANANPGIHYKDTGDLISQEDLEAVQNLLDARDAGKLTTAEFAKRIKDLIG